MSENEPRHIRKLIDFPEFRDGEYQNQIGQSFLNTVEELFDTLDDPEQQRMLTQIVECWLDNAHVHQANIKGLVAGLQESWRQIEQAYDERDAAISELKRTRKERDHVLTLLQQIEDYAGSGA